MIEDTNQSLAIKSTILDIQQEEMKRMELIFLKNKQTQNNPMKGGPPQSLESLYILLNVSKSQSFDHFFPLE